MSLIQFKITQIMFAFPSFTTQSSRALIIVGSWHRCSHQGQGCNDVMTATQWMFYEIQEMRLISRCGPPLALSLIKAREEN